MLRVLGKTLLWFTAFIVAVVATAGGYRAWRQYEGEQALAIAASNGVDEGLFVSVPGGKEWITIRSRDRSRPVLLVVHGGPGTALSPLATSFLPYEQDWTVVQWDQPGAGRTFGQAGDTLPATTTLASIAADGIAVTELALERLGQQRVVLLGVSWGSVVALEMARARPDLFVAYVGTGLFVHRDEGRAVAYGRVLARARTRQHAEAIAALERIGAPPYTTADQARTFDRWTTALSTERPGVNRFTALLFAPRQSLRDVASYFGGYVASDEQFDLGAMDLRTGATTFGVPIIVVQGAEDYDTPIELARAYFESVTAPHKAFVALPDAGHTALVDSAAAFVAVLNEHALPLATGPR